MKGFPGWRMVVTRRWRTSSDDTWRSALASLTRLRNATNLTGLGRGPKHDRELCGGAINGEPAHAEAREYSLPGEPPTPTLGPDDKAVDCVCQASSIAKTMRPF